MKSIPKDRRKEGKDDHREDKIVEKLPDKSGNIGSRGIGKLSVGILAECLANRPIQRVVDGARGKEGQGAAQKDKPSAAEDLIEHGIVTGIGGNGACHEEDGAGEQIDHGRQNRDAVGGLGAEVLGDHIHAHKGKPRDENAAVERDPIELKERFISQQVHADHADNKERDHRCGNGFQQQLIFGCLPRYIFFGFNRHHVPRKCE